MKVGFSRILPSAGALALLVAAPAWAQTDQAASDEAGTVSAQTDEESSDEIVVTGTSIRGVAPAGAAPILLDQAAIAATSATSTVQLLSSIPQIGGFNTTPSVQGFGPNQATNRPGVRGLTAGVSGGSPTLIMMDGHRLAGAGVIQTVADPDIIPPGVLERVEVVTDGGSSIYGADAIGGVINFISRRNFDGVEVNLRQGFGDEYQTTDGYFTAGHTWSGASAYISYNYSQHDAIYATDRDYNNNLTWNSTSPLFGLPVGRCAETLTVGTHDYTIDNSGPTPTFTAASPVDTHCDLTRTGVIYPQERRDSVFAGLAADITESLSFDMRAWYTVRVDKNDAGSLNRSQIITPTSNPSFFECISCVPSETQTVFYSFDDVAGLDRINRARMETWGFSPSLTLDLGADWQARAFLNYGNVVTKTRNPTVNAQAITANQANINFYDFGATDPGILQQILDSDPVLGRGEDQIVNGRVVFDGPLFSLPGGEVRAAIGVEYLGETYHGFTSQQPANPMFDDARRSHAVFGELNIPVVGADNNVPLVHTLTLSLSARRDTYSDFGSVTTPRIGFRYEPVDWLTFRGNWGESFQAPSLADTAQTGSTASGGVGVGVSPWLDWTVVDPATDASLVVFGAAELDAQSATTYSAGFDIRPPIIENLELGFTYYNILYSGMISGPAVFLPSFWLTGVNSTGSEGEFFHHFGADVSDQETTDFLMNHGITSPQRIAELLADLNGDQVLLIDFRRKNLASVQLTGFDANARYTHDTSFGSIYFTASATYQLSNKSDPNGLGVQPNTADDRGGVAPRWQGTATVGATIGDNFTAQATLLHSANIPQIARVGNNFQDEVDPFDVVNLYFQYDVEGSGLTEDVSLSLGVNNAFDQEPPAYNGDTPSTHGYLGQTLGRVVTLGINKRF